jgi:ribosomal protein L28
MKCQICGKTSRMGGLTKKLRGHVNPTAKKWKKPNIQKVTVNGKTIRACTRCIRTLAKQGKI